MFHLKFGCLFGVLAPIFYLQGKFCTDEKLRLIQSVKYVASKLSLLVIFHGNAHQQLARNVWALCRGKIQKRPNDAWEFFALFWMLADWLSQLELDKWATYHGRYGLLETNSIFKRSNNILMLIQMGQSASCWRIRDQLQQ